MNAYHILIAAFAFILSCSHSPKKENETSNFFKNDFDEIEQKMLEVTEQYRLQNYELNKFGYINDTCFFEFRIKDNRFDNTTEWLVSSLFFSELIDLDFDNNVVMICDFICSDESKEGYSMPYSEIINNKEFQYSDSNRLILADYINRTDKRLMDTLNLYLSWVHTRRIHLGIVQNRRDIDVRDFNINKVISKCLSNEEKNIDSADHCRWLLAIREAAIDSIYGNQRALDLINRIIN